MNETKIKMAKRHITNVSGWPQGSTSEHPDEIQKPESELPKDKDTTSIQYKPNRSKQSEL